MSPTPEAARRLWAAGGLALVTVATFWEVLLGRGVFYQRDIHIVWYPRIANMVRAVAEGSWPLWDPYSSFGLPALADPSYQIAYPLTWLNLVLLPATYYKVYAAVHCFGAGLGLCLLVRRWGVSWPGAFLAGAVWSSSGPFLSFVGVLHHFAGLAWMPWVLLAMHAALVRKTPAAALVLGATLAGQVLAGSGDMCLMTGFLAAGYLVLLRLAVPEVRQLSLRAGALGASLAGAAALVLSAVQWLPTAAILAHGSRLRLGSYANTYWSVHPVSLLDVLVPRVVSYFPMTAQVRELIFEGREPFLNCMYLGAPMLILAVLGGAIPGPRLKAFALGAAAFFLLASLGRYTPFYSLLLALPPVQMLRYPVKYMSGASLAVAVLAGMGLDAWGRSWSAAQRRWATGLALAVLALALAALAAGGYLRTDALQARRYAEADASLERSASRLWGVGLTALAAALLLLVRVRSERARGWSAAVGALALLDVVSSGRGVNQVGPPELMSYRPPVLQHLDAASRHERVYVAPIPMDWLHEQFRTVDRGRSVRSALGLQERLTPPTGGRWGIWGSFEGDLTGLAPPALSTWSMAIGRGRPETTLAILRFANVGWVVHVLQSEFAGLPPTAQVPSIFSLPVRLTRVPGTLPRTYVVGDASPAGEQEAYLRLLQPDFDPRREIVVVEGRETVVSPSGFRGSSRLLWQRADALALEVDASHPGFAVVVEAYHPGWAATVDGHPAEVLKANTLFRAVRVPEGRHLVEMRYRPPAAVWGAVLSAAGLAAGTILSLRRLVRRPPPSPPSASLPREGSAA